GNGDREAQREGVSVSPRVRGATEAQGLPRRGGGARESRAGTLHGRRSWLGPDEAWLVGSGRCSQTLDRGKPLPRGGTEAARCQGEQEEAGQSEVTGPSRFAAACGDDAGRIRLGRSPTCRSARS